MGGAGNLAILSGTGKLPLALADAVGAGVHLVAFAGVGLSEEGGGHPVIPARFEELGRLFDELRAAGVTDLCFAGALRRPALDPALFDATTQALAPRIAAAMQAGDDGLLRTVIAIFEDQGFRVRGAHELAPDLVVQAGVLGAAEPDEADRRDADRADAILAALGPLDIGQAAVVAQGQCLGIETVQGTDALLDWVAKTAAGLRPDPRGPGGVLVKRPKPGQDLRIDMPVIGPDTIRRAAKAGLSGVVVAAGAVILIDRAEALALADKAGLFIWAREAQG